METTINLAQLGPIGLLVSAITALWAWHIKTVAKKDSEINEARIDTKELVKQVTAVVQENTKATIEQRHALNESRKASEALNRTLTDYVLKAAGK